MTINDLFIQTLKNHWNSDRFNLSGWAKEAERIYKSSISSRFGSKQINKVSAKDIRNWHKELADTPVAANRALNVLSKMYSYAEEQDLKPQGTNPCKLVKPHKEKKRKRYATPEELKRISAILNEEKERNLKAVAFIYLLMFSGARPRSIERATWGDLTFLDHEGKTFGLLTFEGKSTASTGEAEQVIIPPQGVELLLKLDKKSPTICGIKMPKDFWNRVRKKAGCPDLWARDLRRTFATIGLSSGESSGVIGELLNHKSANTTKIYTQLIQTKKLEATNSIADSITQIIRMAK